MFCHLKSHLINRTFQFKTKPLKPYTLLCGGTSGVISGHQEAELRHFAVRFIHSHSDATGVFRNAFLENCHVEDFWQPCCYTHCILSRLCCCRVTGMLIAADREQGILDLVMHNVLIFLLVNPPLRNGLRMSMLLLASAFRLLTGSTLRETSARKCKWPAMRMNKP